jgi:peptide/nickel transport system ATP-binding protein
MWTSTSKPPSAVRVERRRAFLRGVPLALLEVRDLHVSFPTEDGVVKAVQGVSFSIDPGQTLGIVGESGSGKSVSTQTILGLTRGAKITGEALLEGRDLLTMKPDELRAVRGAKIAMIFQDPLSSLHPQYKVGWQIVEMIRAHDDMSKERAKARAVELLKLVGIPQPERRVDDYPHQFSGGMRQRAMIAMALALNPAVLIADEPTTALDVTVQAQILDLIERIQSEFGTAVIMITHDLGVVADLADEVLVMYAGKPVEMSDRRTIYYRPHHPYTKGLLESIPSSAATGAGDRLKPIKGQPPSLINLPSGCSFHPRCPYVMDVCLTEIPPLYPVGGEVLHRSACHLPADEVGLGAAVEAARVATAEASRTEETVAQSAGARKPRKRTAATTTSTRATRTKP